MHSSSVETAVGKAISPCNTLAQITPYDLDLVRSGDDAFETAFAFSAGEYRKHFGAQLTRGFSGYLCIHRAGRLQAVCGFQSAETPLFLDQYLSAPAWATAPVRASTAAPSPIASLFMIFSLSRTEFCIVPHDHSSLRAPRSLPVGPAIRFPYW